MKTKKMIVAATMAALAVPSAAQATGPGHDKHDGDRGKSEGRGHHHDKGAKGDRGWHGAGWWGHGRKAFVVAGEDVSGLSVVDGKLAGPITLDPKVASRAAVKLLNLTKEQVRGEETIAFGVAGDEVEVKYKGLTATDALQPTDRVFVHGKVKDGVLDIKHVKVWRAAATPAPTPEPTAPAQAQSRKQH